MKFNRVLFDKTDGGTSAPWEPDGSVDDVTQERIRQKAYTIWLSEGQPEGRAAEHWEMARELVAIEDNQASAVMPVNENREDPVEPVEAFENQGEFPDVADQGEAAPGPDIRSVRRARK